MSTKRLSIVADATRAHGHGRETTPVERIFEHWVFMLGKNGRRTALGPARRKVIERALALYDEETLLLAIEGCAASAWHAGDNKDARVYQDIELILRDEAHVERFAEFGEALRERVRQREARRDVVVPTEPEDPAAIAASRERLREAAARERARR